MKGLKPIRKPVKNSYFEVSFRYAHLETMPEYSEVLDALTYMEERRERTATVHVLAANAAQASKYIRENAAISVNEGAKHYTPIEGSIEILGVDPWEPKSRAVPRDIWACKVAAV